MMNVVDSSGWLEYFADAPNADFFAAAIESTEHLIVPVFKRVCQQRGEGAALKVVAVMMQGQVVDLDAPLALNAARLSQDFALRLADSVILATAQAYHATLWTQDAHFRDVPGVRYVEKR